MAFGIPLGVTGGVGGAQAFMEFIISSLLHQQQGAFFAPDGRNIGFTDERLLLAAPVPSGTSSLSTRRRHRCRSSLVTTSSRTACGQEPCGPQHWSLPVQGLERQVPNNDLAWSAPPSIGGGRQAGCLWVPALHKRDSPRKDAAWEFVKFMTSAQSQAIAGRGGEVVARSAPTMIHTSPLQMRPISKAGEARSGARTDRDVFRHPVDVQSDRWRGFPADDFAVMVRLKRVVTEIKTRYAEALSKS